MAASEAVIRDRVISVRTSSDVMEMMQKQTTVTGVIGREGKEECVKCGIGSFV